MIFSADLVRLLDEGTRCRLPPTHVGVRRVRDAPTTTRRRGEGGGEGEGVVSGGGERMRYAGDDCDDDAWGAPSDVAATDRDDEACPHPRRARGEDDDVVDDDCDVRAAAGEDGGRVSSALASASTSSSSAAAAIIYRVIDPESGRERRMTSREKKELKFRMKMESRDASREEKRRLHEQRIRDAKRGKAERLRSKRMVAWRRQTPMGNERYHEVEEEMKTDSTDTIQMYARTTEDDGMGGGMITTKSVGSFRGTDPSTRWRRDHNGERGPASSSEKGHANDKYDAATFTSNDLTYVSSTKGAQDAEYHDAGGSSSFNAPVVRDVPPSNVVGGRRFLPPAMLTPAATLVAMDLGLLAPPPPPSSSSSLLPRRNGCDEMLAIKTVMDISLSSEWARRLQQSMIPAETTRAGEDIRPMAYRLVPEPWRRLCPDSLWTATPVATSSSYSCKNVDEGGATMRSRQRVGCPEGKGAGGSPGGVEEDESTRVVEEEAGIAACRRPSALLRIRDPSSFSTYDEDAYAVIGHLHRHSRLHIACGAAFGCDFLLYDGRREDRHSFAGLRIYSIGRQRHGDGDGENDDSYKSGGKDDDHDEYNDASGAGKEGGILRFPMPSAYDMASQVRTLNTARKIALVAMVVRDRRQGNSGNNASALTARIAIVDLALEKVLTAHAHVRKGTTTKRRSEEDAASGLARKK
ncbi:hypothetical protein ACHAXA_005127 [Cyclostephanos tholiformis]|uniref:tRNA-intron lyase n=1 Tax=Cyclostephanos tholiformis TaxID=382380 RepID=A0ABD3RX95_9STRA